MMHYMLQCAYVILPENSVSIDTINHDELIFVFDSSLDGNHIKGSALTAKRFFHAEQGVGVGLTGGAYALPTMGKEHNILNLPVIKQHLFDLFDVASNTPDKQYMLTRIGCGLSGYKDDDIVRLFSKVTIPDNILLPGMWLSRMNKKFRPRVIVAGGRDYKNMQHVHSTCEKIINPLSITNGADIVCGEATGADALGKSFAYLKKKEKPKKWGIIKFPANWTKFNKAAGPLRNTAMAWYGTHLIAFWDGESTGTKSMIDLATEGGLSKRVIKTQ